MFYGKLLLKKIIFDLFELETWFLYTPFSIYLYLSTNHINTIYNEYITLDLIHSVW